MQVETRDDVRLLAAAHAGDGDAFAQLVGPHERELHAHCYRMLASVPDAEDAVQEALLRAWRGLPRFEGRSSFRTWLYAVATNAALRVAERRPQRVLPLDAVEPAAAGEEPGRPLAESVWLQPCPSRWLPDEGAERRESVELAFVAALQQLPAAQRAALILRDVLSFSARETAGVLVTTVPAVNSLLQRARRSLAERLPEHSQQAELRALGDERVAELARRYARAMEDGDVAAVIALLTEDATWSMPPMSTWYAGHEAIAAFLAGWPLTHRWRHVVTEASGQLAVLSLIADEARGGFRAEALDVLTLDAGRIAAIDAFRDPAILASLGLPLELPR